MELRHLRHFLALAEERNFTRAAARELIVQSGLSSSIRALEREVGAALFVRGTRPVRLTAEGQALVPAARRTIEAAAAAQQAVHDVKGLLTGRLRIGAYPVSRDLLPFGPWLSDFSHAHPGLEIYVRHTGGLDMARKVAEGDLDCAFLDPLPKGLADLEVIPLISEPLMAAFPHDHPLAQEKSVTLDQLAGATFVETDPSWTTRMRTDEAFARAGLTRHITCEVGDWGLVLELVSGGLGIALVPQSHGQGPLVGPTGSVRILPVRGTALERRTDLCLPPSTSASPAARRFASYLHRRQHTEL